MLDVGDPEMSKALLTDEESPAGVRRGEIKKKQKKTTVAISVV